jgi:hypothetical protein
MPVLRARGGHGRRGPTVLQRGGDGHKLNRRVRPVHDDHLPRWQGPEVAAAPWVRGSNPAPGCFAVRGRDGGRSLTCDADSPMLTARARRGPAVTDAVRTQHGPASLDYLLAKPDRTGSSPWAMMIRAGHSGRGIVRGCPLETGQDRCEWHASGTGGSFIPVMTGRARGGPPISISCGPSADQVHHVTASLGRTSCNLLTCHPNCGFDSPMAAALSARVHSRQTQVAPNLVSRYGQCGIASAAA